MRYAILLLIVFFGGVAVAQQAQPSPTPRPSDDEKVYSSKEVDTKAVIKNRDKIDPGTSMGYSSDCPDGVVLILKVVLHKSGKVTDVEVVKPINCSFQEKVIKSVRKIKFTPAIKDGAPVSQYQYFQFNFHKS